LEMKDYEFVKSMYVLAKVKMLNNVSNRSVAFNVPLLFFFKKEDEFVSLVQGYLLDEYTTPNLCPYYKEVSKNMQAKHRMSAYELRMEFYLKIL